MSTLGIPAELPEAICRPRHHVIAVRAQSLHELGIDGRAALAWDWALTGNGPSPVRLAAAPGRPPTRDEILAEADAPPEGSTAPPGVPTDYCDQLAETRRVLEWLSGAIDEIPVDADNRGQLIGARDNYSRTDEEIRRAYELVRRRLDGMRRATIPYSGDAGDVRATTDDLDSPWLCGIADLLGWLINERESSPLCHRAVGPPTTDDLVYEEDAATDLLTAGRTGDPAVNPESGIQAQYGEGVQAAIRWLRGQVTQSLIDGESGAFDPTNPSVVSGQASSGL